MGWAYEKYQEKTYSYVLMDLQMPVMDGVQSTKHIRQFEKEVIDSLFFSFSF
jgi:CheY-like chemotaxis protein